MIRNAVKPIVILMPGPVHLFWTTGVYYLWELSKKYRIVLVVSKIYKIDPLFIKVSALTDVIEILYIPDNYGVLKRHRFYSMVFSELADRYHPLFVFQHNHVYPINMYLYSCAKKRNTQIITMQMGREAVNWAADFNARNASAISNIKNKYPMFPYWFLSLMNKLRKKILFCLVHFILPPIFLKKVFHPGLDIYSGRIYKKNTKNYHDYYLMYKATEKEVTEKAMGQSDKILLIRHPVETIGHECNNILYPLDVEEDRIVILPSYGFIDSVYVKNGIKQYDDVALMIQKWGEIIEVIREKMPDWEVLFKLHPNEKNNIIWENILKNSSRNNPHIVLLDKSEKAEKLILKSKIVVSDVSTVLWWTSFLRSKLAISLDLFGYIGGDDIKEYDNVYYISSMDQFKKLDLSMELKKKITKVDKNHREKNSLIDILKSTIKKVPRYNYE